MLQKYYTITQRLYSIRSKQQTMIIPKGKFKKLENKVSPKDFASSIENGYLTISWRDEDKGLCLGELVIRNGKPILAEVEYINTKRKLYGNEALNVLMSVNNANIEIYELTEEQVKIAITANENCRIESKQEDVKQKEIKRQTKQTTYQKPEKIETTKEIKKEEVHKQVKVENIQKIRKSEKQKMQKNINKEREEILRKYNIKEPSEEEIEQIIRTNINEEYVENVKNIVRRRKNI